MSSDQPSRVLAAALAALAGFRNVPQSRSLLTYEPGFVTLRILSKRESCTHGRMRGPVLTHMCTIAWRGGGGQGRVQDLR